MTTAFSSPPTRSAREVPPLTLAAEVEQQFRAVSPETFFVASRVLRRVLRNELEITSPLIKLPHRKTFVIERDRLLWLVARDELGVESNAVLPARMMLIARPEEDQLARFDRSRLLRHYWQLVYHARLDFHLKDSVAPTRMTTAMLRQRIDRLGQTEFDEIRAVLRQEAMLLRPDDLRENYAEFVAVFCELDAFSPELVPLYFPSLRDADSVRAVIREDCPAEQLLEAITPAELKGQAPGRESVAPTLRRYDEERAAVAAKPSEWRCRQRMRWAQRFHEQGNTVRAALWYQQAVAVAPPGLLEEARQGVDVELNALVRRLQAALELTDGLAATWRRIAGAIAANASRGFWNANIRLLYDLQNVCLDHERETYRVDLWKWLRSLGREPLKRPLPNQRVVLMSKHLHRATVRLGSVHLAPEDRAELSHLLHESAAAAERLMRRRLDPFLTHSLHDTGFVPQSVVEEVAFEKMVEELLDRVVGRGFLTLGDLRDAVSRNQLKMADLAGAGEFLAGDALLQADQRFALLLDGVYQKGPLYLRWLQRLSSLIFGTVWGRNITLYAALPYGSAFMAIRGAEHLVELFGRATGQLPDEPHLPPQPAPAEETPSSGDAPATEKSESEPPAEADPAESPSEGENRDDPLPEAEADSIAGGVEDFLPEHLTKAEHHAILSDEQLAMSVLLLGSIIFVLMHFPQVRAGVLSVLRVGWKLIRWTFYDVPLAVLKFPPIAWLMRSLPVMLFRRYLMTPIVLTLLYGKILPWLGVTVPPQNWQILVFFGLTVAVFISRLGRDTEELFWDWVGKMWYRVRVHLIVGLFTLIVDVFRQVMDGLERLLYAVDEWLRFRKGESNLTLAAKAVLGAVWSIIHAVVRFAVTLLIEPQINPIKHFPVVTVSHKLLVFTIPYLASLLTPFLGRAWGGTIATLIITGIPGVFGFLAWEFKENWKLYAANRPRKIRPAPVGSHGETLPRLLRPGFHSGTIPKIFAKRRRNARKARQSPELDRRAKFDEQLHHVAESIRHFVERDLLGLLRHSRSFQHVPLSLAGVRLATNRIVIEIRHAESDRPLEIMISEQSGRLIAGVTQLGWVGTHSDDRQRRVLKGALTGLYQLGAVDLVREQIESRFVDPSLAYDISEAGLIIWPHRDFEREITYSLDERPQTIPRPRFAARAAGFGPLPLTDLVFREHPLNWDRWKEFWETERGASTIGELLEIRLLPLDGSR